ncbi:hypothetical protein HY992_03035 [Candidatus Micrarchaeota archaeon]|nr:hypothetical protein [Candidatus Micrarchaeota archaeon]
MAEPVASEEDLKGLVPLKKKVSVFSHFKLEKHLADEFGVSAVKVFEKIDGERNAEDIREAAGLSVSELLKVFDYLQSKGVIELKTVFDLEEERGKSLK